MEANKDLATKSQHSAKKLEAMTEAMHLIAVKTKEETVSMRVITLVTLFFLPGTFISVSDTFLLYKLVSNRLFPFNANAKKIATDCYEHRHCYMANDSGIGTGIPVRSSQVVSHYHYSYDGNHFRSLVDCLLVCEPKTRSQGLWR